MEHESAKRIEQWFAQHDGDGEFACARRSHPYSVIGPPVDGGQIILTTKPSLVSTAIDSGKAFSAEFGMVGRYGLPDEADLPWICQLAGTRELLFLGDMDPVDLLVFAWLRARLHPREIKHLGVNDGFLMELGIRPAEPRLIPCSVSERESLDFLQEVVPQIREMVGDDCNRVLERGEKIELEAIIHTD